MAGSIGSVLKAARKMRQITQEPIADAAGVTRGAVSQYEADIIVPTIAGLQAICELLRIDFGSAAYGRLLPLDDDVATPVCLVPVIEMPEPGSEAAILFGKMTDHVEREVLFEPTELQALTWFVRKAGLGGELLKDGGR